MHRPRHVGWAVVAAASLAACVADEGSASCEIRALPAEPTCETHPALCGHPVLRDVRSDRPAAAVDLVFVSEGFDEGSLDAYRARVASWLAALDADPGSIVGRDPARFNRYVVSIPTGGDVTDDDLDDTALQGCLQRDRQLPGGPALLTAHPRLARFAARSHVPDADLVVVVQRTDHGRPNAPVSIDPDTDFGMIVLHLGSDARTLDHEMGHALVHLGDEYVEIDGCYADSGPLAPLPRSPGDWRTALAYTPNLTTDPTGARWSGLVVGALPGGARYARCVYHPTARCRMGDDDRAPFCPVCDAAIDRVLRRYRDGVESRPPLCAMTVVATLDAAAGVRVCPYARSYDGVTRYLVTDAAGRVRLSGTDATRQVLLTPSLGSSVGCLTVRWADEAGDSLALRIQCWSPSSVPAENTLTLTRP